MGRRIGGRRVVRVIAAGDGQAEAFAAIKDVAKAVDAEKMVTDNREKLAEADRLLQATGPLLLLQLRPGDLLETRLFEGTVASKVTVLTILSTFLPRPSFSFS